MSSDREMLDDALRYWETRRLLYNAVLAIIAVGWLVSGWPRFAAAPWLPLFTFFSVATMAANVFYCAAYVADFTVQRSSFRDLWRRWRGILWLFGTAFAATLENNALASCCAVS